MKKEEISGILGVNEHGELVNFLYGDIIIGCYACFRTGQVKYLRD